MQTVMWCHSRAFLWPMFTRRDCSAEWPLKSFIVASSFPRHLLLTGANFFFFRISASFDITLAPHSGNFIEHKETKKHPPPKGGTSRPGDGYIPIYQPTLQRASRPLSLCPSPERGTRRRYQKAWGNSNKFIKLKLFAHFLLSLKALPSSSPSSACVSYVLPSHLCHRFSGKCVYC